MENQRPSHRRVRSSPLGVGRVEGGREEEQGPQHDSDGADDLVVLNDQHRAGADG